MLLSHRVACRPLLQPFVALVQQQLHAFSGRDLALLLWSLAQLGHRPPAAWLAAYEQAAQQALPTCSLQDVSMMVAATGGLSWLPAGLAADLLERSGQLLLAGATAAEPPAVTPAMLAAFAAGLVSWQKIELRCRRQAGAASIDPAAASSDPAAASQHSSLPSTAAWHSLLAAWVQASEPRLQASSPSQLTMMGIAAISLRARTSSAWRAAWLASTMSHGSGMTAEQAVTAMSVAARLRLQPPAAWAAAVLELADSSLPQLRRAHVRQLQAAAHALHARGCLPAAQVQQAQHMWRRWHELHDVPT